MDNTQVTITRSLRFDSLIKVGRDVDMKIYKKFIYTKFNLKQQGSHVKKATWSYTDKVLSYKHIQVNKNTFE